MTVSHQASSNPFDVDPRVRGRDDRIEELPTVFGELGGSAYENVGAGAPC